MLQFGRGRNQGAGAAVSVIIPTLNEASCIAATVRGLRRQHPGEILVVDGGSSDGTPALAQEADLVLQAAAGRASQMNAGAALAGGEVLLFVHADCQLEAGALTAASRCLARSEVSACCFRMCVEAPGICFRCLDACASARVRLAGLIYGDQGLAVRRCDFLSLGGFPPVRFMEDLFFSRRLQRLGRLIVLNRRIFVSPRRWQKVGLCRQTWRNWQLTALALAGVSPDRLAAFYPQVR